MGARHKLRGAWEGQDGGGGTRLLRDWVEAFHNPWRSRSSRFCSQHDRWCFTSWRCSSRKHIISFSLLLHAVFLKVLDAWFFMCVLLCAGDFGETWWVWNGFWARRSNTRARHVSEDCRSAQTRCCRQQDGRPHGRLGGREVRQLHPLKSCLSCCVF